MAVIPTCKMAISSMIITYIMCTVSLLSTSRPNIIFMLVDDIGFNELGYCGCTDTSTPFIDSLVRNESLQLQYNYVFKVCSPTRSALMSGRYPSTLGLQNQMFAIEYPVALTRQVSILSEEFKAIGYSTHCIGKWHLGFPSWEYTPTYRGFDTFYGFLGGTTDYWNHTSTSMTRGFIHTHYDYRINEEEAVDIISDGEFALFHEHRATLDLLSDLKDAENPFFLYLASQSAHTPNEAPSEYSDSYWFAPNSNRQMKQAQIAILDENIGEIVDYLKSSGMWDNTLIVFSSDNGGDYNRGDNSPLREYKNSSFDGGIRVPGFVTGGYLAENRRGQILDDVLVHISDWYPTLLSAAGAQMTYPKSKKLHLDDKEDDRFLNNGVGEVPLDGKNLWNVIQFGDIDDELAYEKRELLLDLNPMGNCSFSACGAIRKGDWKFIRGANMLYSAEAKSFPDWTPWFSHFSTCDADVLGCTEWDGEYNSALCAYTEKGCLFNMGSDPCEVTDVGDEYSDLRKYFIERLEYYNNNSPKPVLRITDKLTYDDIVPDGDFWGPYMQYDNVTFEADLTESFLELFPLKAQFESGSETVSHQEALVIFDFDYMEAMERDTGYRTRTDLKWILFLAALMIIAGLFKLWRRVAEPKDIQYVGKEYDPLLTKQ